VELLEKIRAKIKKDGHLTFDNYMDICLYYPHLGYYNNNNISFNQKNSDFITAPEISYIYTQSIINFYLQCKKYKKIENVLEFGAGSGEMAYNFLKNIEENNIPKKYYILEKSIYLKKQQEKKIKLLPKKYRSIVEWVDEVKDIENVFLLANEVLDAIPSKILFKENNIFHEKVVKTKGSQLYFSKIDCSNDLLEKIKNIESRINSSIPNNYIFEINTLYEKFLSDIISGTKNFIFLIIDYGYNEKELYHPERRKGTIQFYKNHKKISYPLVDQGNFDISISVDFSRINRICNLKKLQLISYTTQTEFLLNTNILENSSKILDTNEKSNILKTLLFPTDMGENFKMMILCDDIDTNFKLSFKDYRHKL
jgi:SAM-dependent MidA family methyltransferase